MREAASKDDDTTPHTMTDPTRSESDLDPKQVPGAISHLRTTIDAAISDALDGADLAPALREASKYAALGPGKRVRPALALRCAEATGSPADREDRVMAAMPAAVAVELIHAFSLVHDDLPSLDNDDLRRGRPTLHVHSGEAMAVLAGDLMLTHAFEILASGPWPDRVVRVVGSELAAATRQMVSGQVYDTLGGFPDGLGEAEKVELIHRLKTGALLTAACRLGPLAAGDEPDSPNIRAVTTYAERIGLMFQIVDDLLDVEQSPDDIGKATGKDADAGKLTFPEVLGVEESRRAIGRLESEALAAVEPLGESAEPLRQLCRWLAIRTR
ncbi:MAG: polyprenyl synthetase family protein [Planctomycetota bacterium]